MRVGREAFGQHVLEVVTGGDRAGLGEIEVTRRSGAEVEPDLQAEPALENPAVRLGEADEQALEHQHPSQPLRVDALGGGVVAHPVAQASSEVWWCHRPASAWLRARSRRSAGR